MNRDQNQPRLGENIIILCQHTGAAKVPNIVFLRFYQSFKLVSVQKDVIYSMVPKT